MQIKLPIPEPASGFNGARWEQVFRWLVLNLKVIWGTALAQLIFDVFVVLAIIALFFFFA